MMRRIHSQKDLHPLVAIRRDYVEAGFRPGSARSPDPKNRIANPAPEAKCDRFFRQKIPVTNPGLSVGLELATHGERAYRE
jgi:hypothetical protein